MFVYLNRFQQYAVKHNLSAAAILFWQYLCFTMAQKNQFERLQQDTAALMQALQITRQGLIGVRKSLERAGLLAVERDENQKLWYTLQLDGKALQPVEEAAKQAEKEPFHGEATRLETEPLCEETEQPTDEWSGIQSGAVCDRKTNNLTISPMQSSERQNMFPVSDDNDITSRFGNRLGHVIVSPVCPFQGSYDSIIVADRKYTLPFRWLHRRDIADSAGLDS